MDTHVHSDVLSGELPGVEVKPVIRHFHLIAIDDLLLEDSVSVTQTVTPSGEVKRSQAIQEASGQTTQATVSESSIVLLADDVLNAESEVGESS
jgi:hypothetical protein